MNLTTPRVRRLAASVAFAGLAGGLALPLLATPAGAVQDTTTRRLDGTDRYGTAAAVALGTFPEGSESVVLATGQAFADALAANGLAGALDAPILLTTRDDLPQVTADALADLGPTTVYVMGGTAAVSQAVEDEVAADFTVERVEGEDRYETAAAAGATIAATDDGAPITTDDGVGSTSEGLTAVLASGLSFPDAVSGGPVAFAGRLPVLLTTANDVPDATLTALEELGIEHILVLGGSAVISDAVETALQGEGYSTERLAGADRWATNAAVNRFAQAEPDYAFGGPTAYLSTGLDFADALAGGPAAGADAAPLVLTAPTTLPAPSRSYLAANANAIDEVVAIGGTAAISDSTLTAAATAARLGSNEAFDVTPDDAVTRPTSASALTDEGAREYEASGLTAGATYLVALVDAETVTTSDQGTSFSDFSLSDEAATSIESVNGTPTGAAGGPETLQEEATAADDGTITFTIDGAAADRVVPVVYEDLDGNEALTLSGQTAAEPFGIGGTTTWGPPEAANGTYDDVTVSQLDTGEDTFVAGGATFNYSSTDRFRSKGTTITPTQFERMITRGDRLDISYFRDAQSLFDVVLDAIPDISNLSASISPTNPNAVQVSWTASAQPDVVYTVHRDNGDGKLVPADDPVVSATGASTSRQFVETVTGPVRYIVLPEGGTSGTGDGSSNDGQNGLVYLTNEVVVGQTLFGLTNGTTVSRNAGLSVLNAGDVWMLHLSRDVQVAPGATITVQQGSGNHVTLTNGTSGSTWSVSGATITITLGSGADAAPDIAYGPDTTITSITGVSDSGGTALSPSTMRDKVLENGGPELMVESTTCDVGDTTCTIAFNEPVTEASAEATSNYSFSGAPSRTISSVVLGADGRTVTLTFSGPLAADDTIRPVGPALFGGPVADDDGQASNQPAFDFVR